MLRKSLVSLAAAMTATPALAVYCSGELQNYWANACSGSAVIVSGPTSGEDVTFNLDNGRWIIVVTLCGDANRSINISSPTGANIERLEIKAGNTCTQDIVVDLAFLVGSPIGDLDLLVQGDGVARLDIAGRIDGNAGDLQASKIGIDNGVLGLTIGGNLVGDIVLSNSAAAIQVRRLKVEGNLEGGLDANNGAIDLIDVDGDIGTANNPATIQAATDIGAVVADEIHANVEALDGNIWAIRTNVGDFTGLISANTLGAPGTLLGAQSAYPRLINIAGDFGSATAEARIRFTEPLTNELFMDVPSAIRIGGSFVDSIEDEEDPEIELPAGGLEGYIIVNNADDGGEWEEGATIAINLITLTGPEYTTSPESIGGGVAGEAPFKLHHTGCVPRDDSIVPLFGNPSCYIGEGDPTCEDLAACIQNFFAGPIILRFRGPLVEGNEAEIEERLLIQKRNFGSETWTDVTDKFTMAIDDNDPSILTLTYIGTGPSHLDKNVEYMITPLEDGLKCLGVAEEPDVEDFTYLFAIYFDCRHAFVGQFDLNEDGVVDYYDLLTWLIQNQDLNFDGNVDAIDFEILYAAILYYENLE